jgi:hypothetical protein
MGTIEIMKKIAYYGLYVIPGVGISRAYKIAKKASKLSNDIALGQTNVTIESKRDLKIIERFSNCDKLALSTELMRLWGVFQWYTCKNFPQPYNYIGEAVGISVNFVVPLLQIMASIRSKQFLSKYKRGVLSFEKATSLNRIYNIQQ